MSVIALAGCPGSPGVTTTGLALLLNWPLAPGRRMVLAECDPDGGAVLHGLLQGTLGDRYGLRNLSVAGRKGEMVEAFWRQLVDLSADDGSPRERLLLPGMTDPAQAAGMGPMWETLAGLFRALDPQEHDVLVDLGRGGAHGASAVLAQRADVVLVVVRNTLRSLQAAQSRVESLEERVGNVGLVLIEEGTYPAGEVQRVLQVPVVASLPFAPREAKVLSDGAEQPRGFVRGPLMRSARTAAGVLAQRVLTRQASMAPPPAGVAHAR